MCYLVNYLLKVAEKQIFTINNLICGRQRYKMLNIADIHPDIDVLLTRFFIHSMNC